MPTRKIPKVHEYKDRKGEHRYRVIASNGKIIAAATEGYKRKAAMRKTIEVVLVALIHYSQALPLKAEKK